MRYFQPSDPNLNYFTDYESLGAAFVDQLDELSASLLPCLICICDPGECPGDLTDDGEVDGADLLQLLACWGPVTPGCECADLTGDGEEIDGADLLLPLSEWGPCPESFMPLIDPEALEECYEQYSDDRHDLLECIFSVEELQAIFGEEEEQ